MKLPNSKLFLLVLVTLLLYATLYLIFPDLFVYVIGGLLGTVVKELFADSNQFVITALLWFLMLVGISLLYYRVKDKTGSIILLGVLFLFLYLFDFVGFELFVFDESNSLLRYVNVGMIIIIKTIVLSMLFYFKKVKGGRIEKLQ